ncbi:unnamed protein product [Camellia sinensis]
MVLLLFTLLARPIDLLWKVGMSFVWMEIEETVAFIRLSDPDGFLLSNELISLAFQVIAP